MGHRANLIIVENKEPKIYYTHWESQKTPNILAQGLEFCENYFKTFNEDGYLMDNAYAEGGILIDKDCKKVLVFGGCELDYTPSLQRLYCKHVTKFWEGWVVKWCFRGIVDIAEYLGLMDDSILAVGCKPSFYGDMDWSNTMDTDRLQDDVTTIIDNAIIYDYKQDWGLDGINICIAKGENLKNIIPDELRIETWHNEIEATDCLLVDYDTKKIFVCWGGNADDRHLEELRKIWSGWEVYRQTDGLIFHFTYTNRDKALVEMTDEQFENYCQEHNLFEFNPDK